MRLQIVLIPNIGVLCTNFPLIRDNEVRSQKNVKKIGGKTSNSKINAQKSQNLRTSGPTPVARGGSGAKAPPLAARPKQHWQAECWLYQCVLRNTLAGFKTWFLCP